MDRLGGFNLFSLYWVCLCISPIHLLLTTCQAYYTQPSLREGASVPCTPPPSTLQLQMARFLTQSLQLRHSLRCRPSLAQVQAQAQAHRSHSTRSGEGGQLFEIELNPSTSSSEGESEALMLKKLDDIVQRILVQKATPDWLPFVPGSSFWVPPRRSPLGSSDFVGKLADKLSDEESLSVATDRGWPCSHFLINGIFVSFMQLLLL